MASLNKVILIGYMTAEPELKATPAGASVCSFSIGVSRKYTKDGEKPQSDFINIVAWCGTAEFVAKHFHKGDAISVCGSLQTRSWTANDGSKRYATEVVADEVGFVERRSTESRTESEPQTPSFEEYDGDSDLPF